MALMPSYGPPMKWPFRVTDPLLAVLRVLVEDDDEVHGWSVSERSGQSGPTVYRAFERLRAAGWAVARWEDANPEPGKPRRRLYKLTPDGRAQARELLEERAVKARARGARQLPVLPFIALFATLIGGRR